MTIIDFDLNEKLENLIDELFQKIKVSCIILASTDGQLISYRKTQNDFNQTNLAVLFASDLGATKEISREISEDSGFDYHLHEGKNQHAFLSCIKNNYVLGIIFDNAVQVGVVRLYAKKLCQKLANILRNFDENHNSQISHIETKESIVESLSEQCNSLFNL